jgi:predicted dienelactone hydrolase
MRYRETQRMRHEWALLVLCFALAAPAQSREAPSIPGVDAPELARLGESAVGVTTLELADETRGGRRLQVDLWYPAMVADGATPETYRGSLTAEPPAPPTAFTRPGIAVRGAQRATGPFPLVVVSHGYDNASVMFNWLTENLASKGYVVAAIRHKDPPITDRARFPETLVNRPLDVAFATTSLQRSLGGEKLVDPARTALVGYSMGGYGVLAAAGGVLDPASPLVQFAGGGLTPFARDGAQQETLRVPGLRAVVALAPAGGSLGAWGSDGLAAITAPMLLIAGDRDFTVDYASGARAFFDQAVNSNRYLLTFLGGGHRIGLGPAPAEMQGRLWDLDWFEDPVWSARRIVGINLHFITAFLDRYVKDDASRSAYLDGLVPESSTGEWPAEAAGAYGAYSSGAGGITTWKGFQRQHAEGLELLTAAPMAPRT